MAAADDRSTAQKLAEKNSATPGEPDHPPVLIAKDAADEHPVQRAKDNSATPATRDTPRVVVDQPEALTAEEATKLAKTNSASPKLGGPPVLATVPEEDDSLLTPNEFAKRNAQKAVSSSPQNKAVKSSPAKK